MGTRRQFSREFKVEAVKLVAERGVAVAQAARDLDVHETRLRARMKAGCMWRWCWTCTRDASWVGRCSPA